MGQRRQGGARAEEAEAEGEDDEYEADDELDESEDWEEEEEEELYDAHGHPNLAVPFIGKGNLVFG